MVDHKELLPRVAFLARPGFSHTQAVLHFVPPAELDQLFQPLSSGLQTVFLLVLAAQFRELMYSLPTQTTGSRAGRIDRGFGLKLVRWKRLGG
jgi:hypothetical protein